LIIKKRNSIDNTTAYQPATQSNTVISRKGVHTVAVKETMYSIARQYGITVDQLREWNTLEGNELKIGQILFVAQPDRSGLTLKQEEEKKQEATKTPVVTTTTPAGNTSTSSSATTSIPVTEKKEVPVKQEVKEQTIKISESVKNGDEVVQAGLAELIEGTEGNRKYLALHRTAPVGTILKIRNEMNNREVFVRVMGKLPESAVSDKLIIKISKSAYDRLGAIDPRFRVEVTYYK
jgi:LysM repeat protein